MVSSPDLVLSLSALVCASSVQEPPAVGDVFPDLPFLSLEDGSRRSLSDHRGTKVLLVQFASW